jgi:MSHA pilin protein MshA
MFISDASHLLRIYRLIKKQGCFTLIEMIIVIIILSILAVSAMPKFIELGSDARVATLESLEGSMCSVSNVVNLKVRIENKTDCSADLMIEVGNEPITLRYRYPRPHTRGIAKAVDADDNFTWGGSNCGGQLGIVEVQITDAPAPNNCKLYILQLEKIALRVSLLRIQVVNSIDIAANVEF